MRSSLKTFLTATAALLLAPAGVAAPGGETPASLQLVIETQDGSRLVGQVAGDALEFEAQPLGRLRLPLQRLLTVRTIPGQPLLEISIRNGDRVVGTLVDPVLRVKTIFGELAVPREQLLSLRVQSTSTVGLRHLWSGEGDARDSAGSAHGTAAAVGYGPGRMGRAFVFNGGEQGVRFEGDAGNFGTNEFSVAFWFRSPAHTDIQYVITKRAACQPVRLWEVRSEPDGRISFPTGDVQGEFVAHHVESRTAVCDDRWHHLVFTRQATTMRVYVDGKLDQTDTLPLLMNFSIEAPLRFGSGCCAGQAGTTHFTGQLDEVGLYDKALSAAEVSALHRAGE